MMRFAEFLNIQEMAQSEGDPAKVQLDLDDHDRDFVSQAVHKGVTPGSAIRARYEVLPQMNIKGDDPVDIKFSGPGGGKTVTIERPHYTQLIKKLKDLGLENASIKGLQAFSRTDAKNFLGGREDKLTGEKRYFLTINHEKSRYADFDKQWGQKVTWEDIQNQWKDKTEITDNPGYDDVLNDVKKLVGSDIKPEVWEKFMEGVENKNYLRTIVNVSLSTLRRMEEHDALTDRILFKTILRQAIAKMLTRGGQIANNPKYPKDYGKMVAEIPQWINSQIRIETSMVVRNWFNKRLDTTARSFQAGKEHDAADLADMGKQVIGRSAPTAPEDELDKEPEQMPEPVVNRMNQPAPQPKPQQDFDYDAWLRQQDQEQGDEDDVAAYRKRSSILPARREWSFTDYVKARDINEIAGATGVVSPVKPGKDYQIEGDPAGSAKSMKNPFKNVKKG